MTPASRPRDSGRVSAVAGRQPGQRRPSGGDRPGARGERRGPDERRCCRRRAHRRQGGCAVGDLPPARVRRLERIRSSPARSRAAHGRRAATARSADARAPPQHSAARSTSTRRQDGEAPAIDFAGAGRTVPWATWYENTSRRPASATTTSSPVGSTTPATPIRASGSSPARPWSGRRNSAGPLAEHPHRPGRREPVGGRRLGGRSDQAGPVGDVAGDGANASGNGKDQIFTSATRVPDRPTATASSRRVSPTARHVPAIGGFCWQQVGIERLGTRPVDERRPDA